MTTETAPRERIEILSQKWGKNKTLAIFVSLRSALTHIFFMYVLLLASSLLSRHSTPRVCPPFLHLSDLLCSYFTRRDIYRAFLIRAVSQPASQPALTPAVILQATRHVNYYANKQCETSVPASHKTARIPSDFRARRDSASVLRMTPASPWTFLLLPV